MTERKPFKPQPVNRSGYEVHVEPGGDPTCCWGDRGWGPSVSLQLLEDEEIFVIRDWVGGEVSVLPKDIDSLMDALETMRAAHPELRQRNR